MALAVQFPNNLGLGDISLAAFSLPLWKKRGYNLEINCSSDKQYLFQAAGCKITKNTNIVYPCHHPPPPALPATFVDHWACNKPAWNLTHSECMPNIGHYSELWDEFISIKLSLNQFITKQIKQTVNDYISKLPRPLILLHTKGNHAPEDKNYPDNLHFDLYKSILDEIGGCILLLDWHNRVPHFDHYQIRHLTKDWKKLNLLELYEVINQADCVVGIDSGILHFCRFTKKPIIGIWTKNYPSFFALPHPQVVHLLGNNNQELTRKRRAAFNLIETKNCIPQPIDITSTIKKILNPRVFFEEVGNDIFMQHLLSLCRSVEPLHHPYRDRNHTFTDFLKLLKPNPTIVETGCIRAEEDFSAGYSTYVFGVFLKYANGNLLSIDINENNVAFAKSQTTTLPVAVHHADSHTWLKTCNIIIDGLYLDSENTCLEEVKSTLPKLSAHAPILIDGTTWDGTKFNGKGAKIIPFLLSQGWQITSAGYQVLLTKHSKSHITNLDDNYNFSGCRTLLSENKLKTLIQTVKSVSSLKGDLAEVGTLNGGSAYQMSLACPSKLLHCFDTFEGMPYAEPDCHHQPGPEFATNFEEVKNYLKNVNIKINKGIFPESAKYLENQIFACAHIDADCYQTTIDAINFFWDKLVPNGYLVLDDYDWKQTPGVSRAVQEAGLVNLIEITEGECQCRIRKPVPRQKLTKITFM